MQKITISEELAKSLLVTRHWKTMVLDLLTVIDTIKCLNKSPQALDTQFEFTTHSTRSISVGTGSLELTIEAKHEISFHKYPDGEVRPKGVSSKSSEANTLLPIKYNSNQVEVIVELSNRNLDLVEYLNQKTNIGLLVNDKKAFEDAIDFKPVELITSPM